MKGRLKSIDFSFPTDQKSYKIRLPEKHPALRRLSGAGNNPMVGMTVAVAVAIEEASKRIYGRFLYETLAFHGKASAKTSIKNWTHRKRIFVRDVSNIFLFLRRIFRVKKIKMTARKD